MDPLRRLITEVHRRSVWQVLAIFVAAGWVVLQVLDVLIQNGILPDWVFKTGLVLLLIGLPIVLATAFVQEGIGTEGPRQPAPHGAAAAVSRPGPETAAPATSAGRHRLFTWRNAILGGVGAFALLGFASAGYMGMRTLGIGAPGTLMAQGVIDRGAQVLLADFASGSDAELGGVVTRTLSVDLLQSRAITLVERTDVVAALQRMAEDEAATVTAARARQVAEREGYALVIAGDVTQAGSGFVLTASILGGEGFRQLAAFRETARSDADLVDAIERLSRSIRDKLGESLRSVRSSPALAQVTTASLPALRAYTRGEEYSRAGNDAAALEQFERAVQLDSTFAMAWRKVAVVLMNTGARRDDWRMATRRAWELSHRLPPGERYLAEAFYHQRVTGDISAAVRAYEQGLELDSLNAAVRNNLGFMYSLLGRYEEAVALFGGGRERGVASLWGNLAGVRFQQGDYAAAQATLDTARAMFPEWRRGVLLQAQLAMSHGDFVAADSLLRLFEESSRTEAERALARRIRFQYAAYRGRLREAERILDLPDAEAPVADPAFLAMLRATAWLQRGDQRRAREVLQAHLNTRGDSATADDYNAMVFVAAELGDANLAAELIRRWRATGAQELGVTGHIDSEYYAGLVARLRGDYREALATLEALQRRCPGCGAFISYEMARTYDAMGDLERARAEYERSLQIPDRIRHTYTLDQPFALRRVAELHDAAGNARAALEYYARFVELWKDADPELQEHVRRVEARMAQLLPDR